jgi:hypothetical protein
MAADRSEQVPLDDYASERVAGGDEAMPSLDDVEAYLAGALEGAGAPPDYGVGLQPDSGVGVPQNAPQGLPVTPTARGEEDFVGQGLDRLYSRQEVEDQQPGVPAKGPESGFVVREAYERVKAARDAAQAELEQWKPLLDQARQYGRNGQEVVDSFQRALMVQNAQSSPYGVDSYNQNPNPPLPLPTRQAEGTKLDPEDRAMLKQVLERQEKADLQIEQQRLQQEIATGLQRYQLERDPLALDYVRMAMASFPNATMDQILKSYLSKRHASLQQTTALKREAGSLTPDVRGGRTAAGASNRIEDRIAQMSDTERRQAAAAALARAGGLADLR